jgi:hypothetical protein
MKTVLFFVSFFILLVVGCSSGPEVIEPIDCGTDTVCFAGNFKSCTPSKIFGGTTEIKSGTTKACEIYFESQDNPASTGGSRLSMTCMVADTDLYEESEMNGFSVAQKAECSGTLYDAYSRLLNR